MHCIEAWDHGGEDDWENLLEYLTANLIRNGLEIEGGC